VRLRGQLRAVDGLVQGREDDVDQFAQAIRHAL
jgi:hypothetical protein